MTQPEEVHSEFERRLVEQYRAAGDETPPPALDKAILDRARAAAAETRQAARPRGVAGPGAVAGPPSRFAADVNDAPRLRRDESRWGRPLLLAASLVLGVGIVVRYETQSSDLSPPSQDKVAQAPAPAEVPPPPTVQPPAADAKAPAAEANVAANAPVASGAAAAPVSPPAPASEPHAKAKDSASAEKAKPAPAAKARKAEADVEARRPAPAPAPARAAAPNGRVDSAMRNNLLREETDKRLRDQAAAELAKPQAAPGGQASAGAPSGSASAKSTLSAGAPAPAPAAAEARDRGAIAADGPLVPPNSPLADRTRMYAAPPPAPAPAPVAPAAAAAPAAPPAPAQTADAARRVPFYEGDPDLWVRHIIDLRRSGRGTTADAELKRLRARYPDYKVSADALPPVSQ